MKFSKIRYFDGWAYSRETGSLEFDDAYMGWHCSVAANDFVLNDDDWRGLSPWVAYGPVDNFVADPVEVDYDEYRFNLVIKDKNAALNIARKWSVEIL